MVVARSTITVPGTGMPGRLGAPSTVAPHQVSAATAAASTLDMPASGGAFPGGPSDGPTERASRACPGAPPDDESGPGPLLGGTLSPAPGVTGGRPDRRGEALEQPAPESPRRAAAPRSRQKRTSFMNPPASTKGDKPTGQPAHKAALPRRYDPLLRRSGMTRSGPPRPLTRRGRRRTARHGRKSSNGPADRPTSKSWREP